MDIFEAFYGKYNRINRACANSVYQASPWGGERTGNKVMRDLANSYKKYWIYHLYKDARQFT